MGAKRPKSLVSYSWPNGWNKLNFLGKQMPQMNTLGVM